LRVGGEARSTPPRWRSRSELKKRGLPRLHEPLAEPATERCRSRFRRSAARRGTHASRGRVRILAAAPAVLPERRRARCGGQAREASAMARPSRPRLVSARGNDADLRWWWRRRPTARPPLRL